MRKSLQLIRAVFNNCAHAEPVLPTHYQPIMDRISVQILNLLKDQILADDDASLKRSVKDLVSVAFNCGQNFATTETTPTCNSEIEGQNLHPLHR